MKFILLLCTAFTWNEMKTLLSRCCAEIYNLTDFYVPPDSYRKMYNVNLFTSVLLWKLFCHIEYIHFYLCFVRIFAFYFRTLYFMVVCVLSISRVFATQQPILLKHFIGFSTIIQTLSRVHQYSSSGLFLGYKPSELVPCWLRKTTILNGNVSKMKRHKNVKYALLLLVHDKNVYADKPYNEYRCRWKFLIVGKTKRNSIKSYYLLLLKFFFFSI